MAPDSRGTTTTSGVRRERHNADTETTFARQMRGGGGGRGEGVGEDGEEAAVLAGPDQDRGTGVGDAADRFGLTSLPPHATEWQERRETDDGITFAPHVQISPPSLLLRYLMGYIQILLSVSPQIAANPPTAIDFFLFTIPLARTPPISSL